MTEIDLLALAREHADQGLSRKKRNASLRRLGLDPAGVAAAPYRLEYDEAMYARRLRRSQELSRGQK